MVTTVAAAPAARAETRGSFSFEVVADAAAAFALLTPEGERRWDPDWNPSYLNSASVAAGTVFETEEGGAKHVWLLDAIDKSQHRIRYVAIWPERTLTTIDIAVTDDGKGKSKVAVSYHRVSLGTQFDVTEEQFNRHLRDEAAEWQKAFARALRGA